MKLRGMKRARASAEPGDQQHELAFLEGFCCVSSSMLLSHLSHLILCHSIYVAVQVVSKFAADPE